MKAIVDHLHMAIAGKISDEIDYILGEKDRHLISKLDVERITHAVLQTLKDELFR